MDILNRQSQDIKSFRKDEAVVIPSNLNYDSLSGLSNEVKSKLVEVKPENSRTSN